jgi:hypothetical protein
MDIYETIYMISETTQLLGNAFMDALSVIFALMVTGYLAGPKLTRGMIWGLFIPLYCKGGKDGYIRNHLSYDSVCATRDSKGQPHEH